MDIVYTTHYMNGQSFSDHRDGVPAGTINGMYFLMVYEIVVVITRQLLLLVAGHITS